MSDYKTRRSAFLATYTDQTLKARIDAIPRHANATLLPERNQERYITLHYSAVNYNLRSKADELNTLVAEAKFHINKVWGYLSNGTPLYGDSLMYDFVVLRDGTILTTRFVCKQLYHCGNSLGNALSWSLHVMTGDKQTLTQTQRNALFTLTSKLRKLSSIPVVNVIGHRHWPRSSGNPPLFSLQDPDKTQPGQGPCPGDFVTQDLAIYSAYHRTIQEDCSVDEAVIPEPVQEEAVQSVVYRVRNDIFTLRVSTGRSYRHYPQATINNNPVTYAPGSLITIGDVTDGWGHLTNELGFVPMEFVTPLEQLDSQPLPMPLAPIMYSPYSSITVNTQSDVNVTNLIQHVTKLPKQTYSEEDVRLIVGYYIKWGNWTNVDWLLAFAQNAHETDTIRSWWAQRPRRNPAGLRVTGESRPTDPGLPNEWSYNPGTGKWHKGLSFANWDHSTQAHITLLLSYAHTNNQLTDRQFNFMYNSPIPWVLTRQGNRGVAPQIIGLNGRWAVPGTTYATSIARVANSFNRK